MFPMVPVAKKVTVLDPSAVTCSDGGAGDVNGRRGLGAHQRR